MLGATRRTLSKDHKHQRHEHRQSASEEIEVEMDAEDSPPEGMLPVLQKATRMRIDPDLPFDEVNDIRKENCSQKETFVVTAVQNGLDGKSHAVPIISMGTIAKEETAARPTTTLMDPVTQAAPNFPSNIDNLPSEVIIGAGHTGQFPISSSLSAHRKGESGRGFAGARVEDGIAAKNPNVISEPKMREASRSGSSVAEFSRRHDDKSASSSQFAPHMRGRSGSSLAEYSRRDDDKSANETVTLAQDLSYASIWEAVEEFLKDPFDCKGAFDCGENDDEEEAEEIMETLSVDRDTFIDDGYFSHYADDDRSLLTDITGFPSIQTYDTNASRDISFISKTASVKAVPAQNVEPAPKVVPRKRFVRGGNVDFKIVPKKLGTRQKTHFV